MRASCSTGPTETCGYLVTTGADAGFRPDERDEEDFGGFARSAGAGRDRTLFFEQIGQSAVKRLWRQKSEVIDCPRVRALPRSPAC